MERPLRVSTSISNPTQPPPLRQPRYGKPGDKPLTSGTPTNTPVRASTTPVSVVALPDVKQPLTAYNNHLLYYLCSTRYRQEPNKSKWARHSQSTTCFCVGLSVYSPLHKAEEPIANPIGRLDGIFNLALFGNSLALTSTMGPKEGYLFMKLIFRIHKLQEFRPISFNRDISGYSVFPHNLNEKLIMNSKSGLTINEIRILMTVLRFTNGYQRTKAPLSLGFIENATLLKPRRIREALKSLERRRIIIKVTPHSSYPKRPAVWKINFNWRDWIFNIRGDKTVQGTNRVISQGTKHSNSQGTNLRTNKDSSPKDRKNKYMGSRNINSDFSEELKKDEVDYQIGG